MKTALCLLAAAALFALSPTAAIAGDWPVEFASCSPHNFDSVRAGPDNTTSSTPMTWGSSFDSYGTLLVDGPARDVNDVPLDQSTSTPGQVYHVRMVSPGGYVTDIQPGFFYFASGDWYFHFDLADKHTENGLISAPN